jgi:N-acetyl-alpha-D-muramate 1-phosphate uridylyltransferase
VGDGDLLSQVVILAGGLGTRMRPRTDGTPKFLLPVAGRPFGAWLLERLAAAGFGEAVLCVGHLGEAVRAAMGDRFAGLALRYADDGPTLLGTAGALQHARALLAPTFLVTYGDSYLPFDYQAPLRDLQAHPEALGTMAVYRNEGRLDASNTTVSGDRVVRYEKRRAHDPPEPELDHIDYGATALRREVVEALPAGAPLGFEAVQRDLAARGRLRALPVATRFYEIGSERGLLDLEAALRGAQGGRR